VRALDKAAAMLITSHYSFYASARSDSVLPNAGWAEGPEGCLRSRGSGGFAVID